MVKGAGTAVFYKVRHGSQRGVVYGIGADHLEYFIDFIKPLNNSNIGVIHSHKIPHKGLKKVMVRIYKPGIDKLALS